MLPLYYLAVPAGGLLLWLLADDAPSAEAPKSMKEWIPYAKKYGAMYGVDPALLLSFIEHESGGNSKAIRYECCKKDASGKCIKGTNFGGKAPCPGNTQRHDSKGRPVVSKGPMQFLIGTAEQYGVPASQHEELRNNPDLAVEVGAKFLKELQERYAGRLYYMAASYNGGAGGADKAFRKGVPVTSASVDKYAHTAQALYQKWKGVEL